MDQYLNNRHSEILWKLLANPADNGHSYGQNIEQLATDYPQSGLFHALLARANRGESIQHAAASFDTKALYVMMNAYENLAEVTGEQIIQQLGTGMDYPAANSHNEQGEVSDSSESNNIQLEALPVYDPANEPEISDKVVVGEDEQQEVDNLDIQTAPEQVIEETETEPEPVIEVQQEETETALETEMPVEDHRADMPNPVFEEEIIELPKPEPEEILEQAEKAPEPSTSIGSNGQITETPVDDHRTEMYMPVFEEEIIELPEPESEEIPEQADEVPETPVSIAIDEQVAEVPADDHRAELFRPAFEEEIIELPADEENFETSAVIENVVQEPSKDIEDDVYDEIVGIENINFTHTRPPVEEVIQPEIAAASIDEEQYEDITKSAPLSETIEANDINEPVADEADTSYFVFEKEERRPVLPDEPEHESASEQINEQAAFGAETQDVSKYHDDKMPYTFMWWLDKTRREHAGIYQPFKLDTTQAIRHTADGTLQQQYYENIFHVTTIEELNSAADQQTIEFDMKNKEDRLIKKFIIEEPHISTPSSDKLDNENKAKKSAEDQDEMVTETLARIYVDQMLYHKAINTYKKLILKFPEKSRYFADQIELLERKIN